MLKKIIISLFIVLILSSCNNIDNKVNNNQTKVIDKVNIQTGQVQEKGLGLVGISGSLSVTGGFNN